MRIVAGRFKGRAIIAPAGQGTRPTSDRARQAVFNVLEHAAWAEPLEGARRYLTIGSDNLRRAVAAGVPVLLGTDVNNPFVFPGYSMHEELGLAVAAGLTPAQALDRATRHSAAFLGFKDAGTVAPGNQADLILLAANPLEAIGNSRTIVTVLSDGAVVPDPVSLP